MSASVLVEALVQRYGSLNAASRKADIPLTTLFQLQNGRRADPRFSTIRRIADALGLSLPDAVQLMDGDGTTHDTEPKAPPAA
jgi:predicted transcriptional regulator